MKTETKNPFETFLSVCRMHAQAGKISADIPLMYLHGDGPDDCYAVYQEWEETETPTVWKAQLKVVSADVVEEDLLNLWTNVIELPPMKIKDMPDTGEGKSVVARINSMRERRDRFAKMAVERAANISGDPVIDRVLTWVRDTFPGARMDRIQQPDIPDWLVEPLREAEAKNAGTDCLILSGGYEFGTESYAGGVKFYRDPKDNVQVAIPNGMRWSAAVENLRKVTEDLKFWINTRTDTTIEDLDMITEREIDSRFPQF